MFNRFLAVLLLFLFSFTVYAQERTIITWSDEGKKKLKETFTVVRIGSDSLVKQGKYII